MSPSPQDAARTQAVRDYHDAWRAVMQLVRSGYSWSGHERNCVFLNCSPPVSQAGDESTPRFADISAVSGLDFPDDGRGVAVVDWDQDGDLDLWLRNRSAPRLRLMRNLTDRVSPADRSIAVRLIGTTCNRDAIGARAELVLKTVGASRQRLVRSVRAGDAFLSQSSSWLHFGIGKDAVVESLIVTWPGGQREQFDGLSPGARFEIQQGARQAVRVKQRDAVKLTARPYQTLTPSAAARIVLPGKVALPPITFAAVASPSVAASSVASPDVSDSARPSAAALEFDEVNTPTLVAFWTSSCPNCCRELTGLAENRAKIEQAKLRVIAVCLDGLDDPAHDPSTGLAPEAQAFLREIEFPFQAVQTDHETIELLDQFQRSLFGQFPGFVVPLSFLVDSQGHVVSIYRGAYSHETFLQDRELTDAADDVLRTLATPLPGRWITKPATRSQFADFVGSRLAATHPKAALRYLKSAMDSEEDSNRKRAIGERVRQMERIQASRAD